ncbi:MAG: membrane protein insertion efficiency factor YidD [Candidatus Latescibacteria bacterium]|nr:membrane protein insertion efficiency factor YidD [Candidatus Latescibacterota bacterium]
MARCFILLIRIYSIVVSPLLLPACRFQPTCSEYAVEVLKKYGIARGGWLACRRLLRCHPWGGHGFDPS